MTRSSIVMAGLVLGSTFLGAQTLRTYHIVSPGGSDRPTANSVNEIVVSGDTLWVGTSRGLSVGIGSPVRWWNWSNESPFAATGISAIALEGDIVWAAAATSTKQDGESLPTGDGLYRSTDRGASWTRFPQPTEAGTVDTIVYGINRIPALNIGTSINNITYDLAVGAGNVWTANFAGMLRRSSDLGATWHRVVLPPDGLSSISPGDSLDFDLAPTGGRLGLTGNLNHRVFSVMVDSDTTIWVGTAGGINRSTDGGTSWTKFTHANQANGITGNFVVALREQIWAGQKSIWAATINAESGDEKRGVSWSTDNGSTWRTGLLGEFAHNIAVRDSIVYVSTDAGLYRTDNAGATWTLSGSIVDPISYQRLTSDEIITAGVRRDTVWIGGPDGLASSADGPGVAFGERWSIVRAFVPVQPATEMYVYPNPFSPAVDAARIHYAVPAGGGTVTIRIFDVAMQPVRDLLVQAQRPAGQHDEVWDGQTMQRRQAANGVYFVRVEVGPTEAVWGKVVVLQ